jgi:hypothetical protein
LTPAEQEAKRQAARFALATLRSERVRLHAEQCACGHRRISHLDTCGCIIEGCACQQFIWVKTDWNEIARAGLQEQTIKVLGKIRPQEVKA